MTNNLVVSEEPPSATVGSAARDQEQLADIRRQGDVYLKIIEEVIAGSKDDFETAGVGQDALNDLEKVSRARGCPCSPTDEPTRLRSFSAISFNTSHDCASFRQERRSFILQAYRCLFS
jgi:hypothetical protein